MVRPMRRTVRLLGGWPQRNIRVRKHGVQCNLLFVVVSVLTAFGIGVAHSKDCQSVTFPGQARGKRRSTARR
jgi:hypothetical protein